MFGFQTKISSLRVVKARQRQTYRSMMRKTSRSCSFAQSSWKDLHLRTSRSISTTFSSVSAYPVLHYVNFEDCQILSLRVPRGATHTCHYHKTCELFLTYTHCDVRNRKCAFKMSCIPLDHNVGSALAWFLCLKVCGHTKRHAQNDAIEFLYACLEDIELDTFTRVAADGYVYSISFKKTWMASRTS